MHGNMNPDKAQLRKNVYSRLESLYVLFPKNHPLHVQYSHTRWDIPIEVIEAIWREMENALVMAYQKGYRKGHEKGIMDAAFEIGMAEGTEGSTPGGNAILDEGTQGSTRDGNAVKTEGTGGSTQQDMHKGDGTGGSSSGNAKEEGTEGSTEEDML